MEGMQDEMRQNVTSYVSESESGIHFLLLSLKQLKASYVVGLSSLVSKTLEFQSRHPSAVVFRCSGHSTLTFSIY